MPAGVAVAPRGMADRAGMLAGMARGTRIHPLVPGVLGLVVVAVLVLVVVRAGRDDGGAEAAGTTTAYTQAPVTTSSTATATSTTATEPERVAVEDLVAAGPTFDAPLAYRIPYDVVAHGLPRGEEWRSTERGRGGKGGGSKRRCRGWP